MNKVIACCALFVVGVVNAQGSLRLHVAEDVEPSFAVSDYTPHREVVATVSSLRYSPALCARWN